MFGYILSCQPTHSNNILCTSLNNSGGAVVWRRQSVLLFDEPNLKKLQEYTNKTGRSQFSESMAHMYRLEVCFENTPTLPQAHKAQLWGLRAAVTTWDSPHAGWHWRAGCLLLLRPGCCPPWPRHPDGYLLIQQINVLPDVFSSVKKFYTLLSFYIYYKTKH